MMVFDVMMDVMMVFDVMMDVMMVFDAIQRLSSHIPKPLSCVACDTGKGSRCHLPAE
jgi:hypothetical protein